MATHAKRARKTTRAKKRVRSYIILCVVALGVVAIVISFAALARGTAGTGAPSTIIVPAPRPAAVVQSGHTYGDPNAPVTIDEYIDFQCPFCKTAALSVMPIIEQEYVESGVAKVVVHPIAILGDESVQAAVAAEAANQQGQFFAYYDALYSNQGYENRGAFSDDRLKAVAEVLGLDMAEFNASFDSGTYAQQVTQDTLDAAASGVRSTPTILVNGTRVSATVDSIAAAIQSANGS